MIRLRLLLTGFLWAWAGMAWAGEPLQGPIGASVVALDGGQWLLAADPQNVGQNEAWFGTTRPDARPTRVPWIIQDVFSGYQGVAWYWREFVAPPNAHAGGRYLLKFYAVDYAADVWLNGTSIGRHEGGETPFVLDATEAVKPNAPNLLAVRVLTPTQTPIDGLTLDTVPHGVKKYPLQPGGVYNVGGIVDSVELILAPAVRIDNLFVRPDAKSGAIRVDAAVRNASAESAAVALEFTVADASGGPTLNAVAVRGQAAAGDTPFSAQLTVPNPRLWNLDDPHLYRVTVRVRDEKSQSFDEQSTRCGFREFRFENGYFRLNGRRVMPRGPLNLIQYPIGHVVSPDPDYLRRDVVVMKALGMNICRTCFGGITARQLDIYDELGVMVYMENYGGWLVSESPNLEAWTDRALAEVILRDRNHPSVVAWGILNETHDGRLFRHAVTMLPLVRSLDDSRMVFLSSGRWDNDYSIGSISNPGSSQWESTLRDHHWYPEVPHSADTIRGLRTLGTAEAPMFLSEYGTGNAINLPRYARPFEQRGAEQADDARHYRCQLDRFLADWERWRLADIWAQPEDFFAESDRTMAGLRRTGENALRSNPHLVGHLVCALADSDFDGVGVINHFRELKEGSTDMMADVWAPLRWCVFAEPVNVYRGAKVQLEAVLANEDVLKPGEYPVHLQVLGPDVQRVLERKFTITIPDRNARPEPPLALAAFCESVDADWPAGKYRLLVTFERGAAAMGGATEFYVADAKEMPPVEAEVTLWGDDPDLAKWLGDQHIRLRPYGPAATAREVILIGAKPAGAGVDAWRELARRIAAGSKAIFLGPEVFARGDKPTGWAPLREKGGLANLNICGGYYRADAFSKRHPVFDGLPSGGIMDYTFYREIIPQVAWIGLATPAEAVAGEIRAQFGYDAGLITSVHNLGNGQFVLNTLRIRENLGRVPAAERLLRNLLRWAAGDADKPLVGLSAEVEDEIQTLYPE
jgi:hypothetical protein